MLHLLLFACPSVSTTPCVACDVEPPPPAIEVTDLDSYTRRCEQVLGPFPSFSCSEGVEVPVTVTTGGRTVVARTPDDLEDGACDRPSYLSGCTIGNRLGTVVTAVDDSTYTFVCRADPTAPPGEPRYDDLGVIGHNPVTGDTCFWAVPIDGRTFDGDEIPRPGSPEDAIGHDGGPFWYSLDELAGSTCTRCHDNDPYLQTPWVHQTGVVPELSGAPYRIVAEDVLVDAGGEDWRPARALVHPEAQACTSCHELADRFTCGTLARDATGSKSDSMPTTLAFQEWPRDRWMDDFDHEALAERFETVAAWEETYRDAVTVVGACCDGWLPDEACWR